MKTFEVELMRWAPSASDDIEIPWPRLHHSIGLDQCSWLLAQPPTHCQLMLLMLPTHCAVMAQFYHSRSWRTYNLMWAK